MFHHTKKMTAVFLFVFVFEMLLTISITQRVVNPCQFWDNGLYFQGKCYKFFSDRWLDWESAQDACAHHSSSGHLAEPVNPQQINALKKLRDESDGSTPLPKSWIGAFFNDTLTEYLWTLNEDVPVTGQIPALAEGCVTLDAMPGTMEPQLCSSFNPYICEQAVPNPCDVFLPGAAFYQGSCYLAHTDPLSHTAAQEVCNKNGSFLAEPKTTATLEFLKTLSTEVLWLGGIHSGLSSAPNMWATSGETISTAIIGFTILSSGWCLGLNFATGLDCNHPKEYLCQKDIGDPCEESYPGSVYAFGYCFHYVITPETYQVAEHACLSKNGYIAELHTPGMQDYILDLMMYEMREAHTSCDGRGSAPIWIGLTHLDLDTSSRWRTDGAWVEDRDRWLTWHDGFGANDSCAVMTGYGEWEQRACSSHHIFICQTQIYHETQQRYVIPLTFWKGQATLPEHLYLTASTSLTSHNVYLMISYTLNGNIKQTRTFVNEYRGYYLSLHALAVDGPVIEVFSTHPVTLTLARGSAEVLTSSLVYPTMEANAPWLYQRSYFVLASPVFPSVQSKILLAVVAVEPGQTNGATTIAGTYTQFTLDPLGVHEAPVPLMKSTQLDGSFIEADKEIVVFFMQTPTEPTGSTSSTLKQLPPYSLLSDQVITLPSIGAGIFSDVSMKVAATEAMSYVALPYTMKETYTTLDPEISGDVYAKYISNGESALDMALLTFEAENDVSTSYPAANAFAVQSGNASFYSTQSFVLKANKRSFCTLPLSPQMLWKRRYVALLFPSTNSGRVLALNKASAYIYLVLETRLQGNVYLDGALRQLDCRAIEDSDGLSGCVGQLDTANWDYNHLLTIWMQEPFAAYMFTVYTQSSAVLSCQPLGIDLPPENFYDGPMNMNENTVTLVPPLTTQTTMPTTVSATTTPQTTTPTTPPTTVDPCLIYTTQNSSSTASSASFSTSSPDSISASTSAASTSTRPASPSTQPQQPPQPSQQPPPSTNGTSPTFTCSAPGNVKTDLTEEEENELVKEIQKALFVSPRNTTMAKRKKISAEDKRSSSAYIGVLGIVLFSIEVALIVLPDLINFYQFFYP